MGMGIIQGLGAQAKAMAFGSGRSDPYGFFGGKGPGLRDMFEKGGFTGAYEGMKNWLGVGFEDVAYSRTGASKYFKTIKGMQGASSDILQGLVGDVRQRVTLGDQARAIFGRRRIGTGIGVGAGALALGGTVGFGNVLKGGGMWAASSMIGGALGATKAFGGQAAAGRRLGGRVGLGLFGGYKAIKWGGGMMGAW